MPVSRSRSFAFIHVRKTGGTAIMSALRSNVDDFELNEKGVVKIVCAHPRRRWMLATLRERYPVNTLVEFPQWHLPAVMVRAILGPAAWEGLFTFAFVRNPWELVVSAYHFDQGELGAPWFRGERDRVALLESCSGFEDYVRLYPLLEPADQTSMIADEAGDVIVNFVGRMERLDQDFGEVCRRIGLEPSVLPRENETKHDHYRGYYTPETRQLVARYFARDIERFGFEF